MEKTQRQTNRPLKLLILLTATFFIGFGCGRKSRKQEILDLEGLNKSIGWWNMQLENEIDGLKDKLQQYE